MSRDFDQLYADVGRPSIPPERLLRAQLLQIFYSIRSERLLMEQLDYNILFRWFVGMDMDEPVWAPTVFTKNRDRLLNQEIARSFFGQVVERAQAFMSDEHFTVDGTLIEAWASQKSFQRKDGGTATATGAISTARRGRTTRTRRRPTPTRSCTANRTTPRRGWRTLGHLLIENRHGLIVDAMATDGRRHGRARRGDADAARADAERRAVATAHRRRRQELRHARLRRGDPRVERDAARHAEPDASGRQCDRRADDAPRGLRR